MNEYPFSKLVADFDQVAYERKGDLTINEAKLIEVCQLISSHPELLQTPQSSEEDSARLTRCVESLNGLLDEADKATYVRVATAVYHGVIHLLCKQAAVPLPVHDSRYLSMIEKIKKEIPLSWDRDLRRLISVANKDSIEIGNLCVQALPSESFSATFARACDEAIWKVKFQNLIDLMGIKDQESIPRYLCDALKVAVENDPKNILPIYHIPDFPEFTEAERLVIAKTFVEIDSHPFPYLTEFLKMRPLKEEASRHEIVKMVAMSNPKELPSFIKEAFDLQSYKFDDETVGLLLGAYNDKTKYMFANWSVDYLNNLPHAFIFKLCKGYLLYSESYPEILFQLGRMNVSEYAIEALKTQQFSYDQLSAELKESRQFILDAVKVGLTDVISALNTRPLLKEESFRLSLIQMYASYFDGRECSRDFYKKALQANKHVAWQPLSGVDFDREEVEIELSRDSLEIYKEVETRYKTQISQAQSREEVQKIMDQVSSLPERLIDAHPLWFDAIDDLSTKFEGKRKFGYRYDANMNLNPNYSEFKYNLPALKETEGYKNRLAAINFAQIVLFSDDFVKLIEGEDIPDKDKEELIKFRRYFDITKQLPMELQMKVANMTQAFSKERISSALTEWALRYEVAKLA